MLSVLMRNLVIVIFFLSNFTAFQSFAQNTWYKYPGNPVFNRGCTNDWDYYVGLKTMIFDKGKYHLWYKGSDKNGKSHLGYATSADGIHWEKFKDNPLSIEFGGSGWESVLHHLCVLKPDSLYYLWYSGFSKDTSTGPCIGLARSADGLKWEKLPDPVLKPEKEKHWELIGIVPLSVVYRNNTFHMWYTGIAGPYNPSRSQFMIGYATSKDGIHWNKYPGNPVFTVASTKLPEDNLIMVNSVVYNGSGYDMFYSYWNGVCWQIGHATSINGISWLDSGQYPVLGAGELGSWDSWLAASPSVILRDSVYHLWYNGEDKTTKNYGYATTSPHLAERWEKDSINVASKFIWVRTFNSEERVPTDSLELIIPELSGRERADALNKLALAYSLYKPEKSSAYAMEALRLSGKINYPQGKAMALYVLGNSQYVLDNYTDALRNQLRALQIYDSLQMRFEAGIIYSQIASIQSYAGSHELACKYYQKALYEFLEIKDSLSVINTLELLGYSQLRNGDTSLAINTFNRRIVISKLIGRYGRVAGSNEALGVCYTAQNLDSALIFLSIAYEMYDTLGMGRHFSFVDLLKAEAYESAGPEYYDQAYMQYMKSVNERRNASWFRVRLYYRLAQLEFLMSDYIMSRYHLDNAFRLCQNYMRLKDHRMFTYLNEKLEFEMEHIPYMANIYSLYFQLDTVAQDQKRALSHYMLASHWKDSIHDNQRGRQWAMMQGEYEMERAESKIEVLEKENEVSHMQVRQSRAYLFAMGAFFIVLGLMSVLFIRQNRMRAYQRNLLLEQKVLRLQMNPHFMYNSLSDLQGFIWSEDKIKANEYLSSFARLMRLILENSRQDFVPVEKEINAITHYLKLQSLRYRDKFNYTIQVDEEIDEEHMLIPPMLSQPFIENSIEHGILPKTSTGHIEVKFMLKDEIIHIDVVDDGIGFSGSSALAKGKQAEHESLAMQITRERLLMIYKKYKQKINFTIADILDDENKVKGARVSFAVPYSLI